MISSKQAKLARIHLDLTQDEVAEAIGKTRTTIFNIESSDKVSGDGTLGLLQKFYERKGIEFLSGNGIRERDNTIEIIEGENAESLMHDDIFETVVTLKDNKEVLLCGLEEADPKIFPEVFKRAKLQVERLKKAGIKERILGKEGNTNFVCEWHWYRWLPEKDFNPVPFYIYGTKLAFYTFEEPYKAIIIDDAMFTATMRHLFNFAWDRAAIPTQPSD